MYDIYAYNASCASFFFNDTATTEIYTLSLHDALPILRPARVRGRHPGPARPLPLRGLRRLLPHRQPQGGDRRSEEHTSELQSRQYLVCRLLLEKKKITKMLSLHSHQYILFVTLFSISS